MRTEGKDLKFVSKKTNNVNNYKKISPMGCNFYGFVR